MHRTELREHLTRKAAAYSLVQVGGDIQPVELRAGIGGRSCTCPRSPHS
jgi:hypothetical protein